MFTSDVLQNVIIYPVFFRVKYFLHRETPQNNTPVRRGRAQSIGVLGKDVQAWHCVWREAKTGDAPERLSMIPPYRLEPAETTACLGHQAVDGVNYIYY